MHAPQRAQASQSGWAASGRPSAPCWCWSSLKTTTVTSPVKNWLRAACDASFPVRSTISQGGLRCQTVLECPQLCFQVAGILPTTVRVVALRGRSAAVKVGDHAETPLQFLRQVGEIPVFPGFITVLTEAGALTDS
eukprot:gene19628-biopygen14575